MGLGLESSDIDQHKPTVCVLDASNYVGFWLLKGLLNNGYTVHAAIQKNGEKEIVKRIKEMEKKEEKLEVFSIDILDYQSVVVALKDCCGLFCSLDSPEGYDEKMVDQEVRGAINVIEACAQTNSIHKIVFTSSLAASIWRDNVSSPKDIDERSWSDQHFCKKLKLWYALAKTLSEKAAWGLAMDRMINMVSINSGLVLGPGVAQLNSRLTMCYLKGASQMYENGVLAHVDVKCLVDVHLLAFEDPTTSGRYFCFNHIVNDEQKAVKLVHNLSPLISLPARYDSEGAEVYPERLSNKKLIKFLEATTP